MKENEKVIYLYITYIPSKWVDTLKRNDLVIFVQFYRLLLRFYLYEFQMKVCSEMNNIIMADKKKENIYEDNDEKQFLKLVVSI